MQDNDQSRASGNVGFSHAFSRQRHSSPFSVATFRDHMTYISTSKRDEAAYKKTKTSLPFPFFSFFLVAQLSQSSCSATSWSPIIIG